MTNSYDVLIVGCGPSGATLANLLRMNGHKVAIFDRDKDIFPVPRAMMLDPESCRIYQQLGVMERMDVEDARPLLLHQLVDGNRKKLLESDFSDLDPVLGHPAVGTTFHQPSLERFLRDDFEEGVKVDTFLGYEVLGVTSHTYHAAVAAKNTETGEEVEVTGRYIVGADGGASLCRRAIGANRIDFNYRRKWIVIDTTVHDTNLWNSLDNVSEFMLRPNAAAVFVAGHHNHVRFDFEIDDERAESFTRDDAMKHIATYIDTSSVEIMRMIPYSFYAGMPDIWRKGRILLAGDAAHQTPPFAGQGLNMGLRDAAHLSYIFDLLFSGKVDDRILDTYQTERWPQCKKLIDRASRTGSALSTTGFMDRLKRNLGFFLARNIPSLARKATANSNGSFPSYSGGLVGTGHELCGARLIQPPVLDSGGTRKMLDEVIGNGFVLLLSKGEESEAISWFKQELGGSVFVVGEDFQDSDGKLSKFTDGSALLVRPDRYIYGAGESGSEICTSFRQQLRQFQSQ